MKPVTVNSSNSNSAALRVVLLSFKLALALAFAVSYFRAFWFESASEVASVANSIIHRSLLALVSVSVSLPSVVVVDAYVCVRVRPPRMHTQAGNHLLYTGSLRRLYQHTGTGTGRLAAATGIGGHRRLGIGSGSSDSLLYASTNHDTNYAKRHSSAMSHWSEQGLIRSASNDKAKLLRSLQEKKKRDALELVLLEGHRQVIDALSYGLRPKLLFVSERGLRSPLGSELVKAVDAAIDKNEGITVEMVDDALCDSLSDASTTQGVLGAFAKPPSRSLKDVLSSAQSPFGVHAGVLLLVLDGVMDPGNFGSLIRSAVGFGCVSVVAIDCCDAWSPKVLRSSMGTALQIPLLQVSHTQSQTESAKKALQAITNSPLRFKVMLAEKQPASVDYDDALAATIAHYPISDMQPQEPSVAIVIGSEARGICDLTRALLTHSEKSTDDSTGISSSSAVCSVVIPMARQLDSFNAAIAGSVLLAEASKLFRKRSNSDR